MATTKKTTASKAASKSATVAEHSHAALEAEIAGLKKLIEDLQKENKALSAKCDACCAAKASEPEDERIGKMWAWLRRYKEFRSFNL